MRLLHQLVIFCFVFDEVEVANAVVKSTGDPCKQLGMTSFLLTQYDPLEQAIHTD